MSLLQQFATRCVHAGSVLRQRADRSLDRPDGGWWVPSIAACVVWALLAHHEHKGR
jgi:hypothetical protein